MTRLYPAYFILFLVIIIFVAYSPGVSGPFLFDDITSITTNSKLQLQSLNTSDITDASLSGYAGPLKRPVAMLSFALNYYFAGGYVASAFKITNIAIHCLNAILLFVLAQQLLLLTRTKNQHKHIILAAGISIIWALHPINLTSVLYVVQRMTSLSTLFSLGSVILYIAARTHQIRHGVTWVCSSTFLASILSLTLALFSKENAVLVPLLILLIELTLFTKASPWTLFNKQNQKLKFIILLITFTLGIFALLYSINYAAGGFNNRPFTMLERVYTETRVLCLYLSLIFVPRINELGLFHDDIILSTSLISPWTTFSSTVFIITLLICAIYNRKRNPLLALGIGWFFIGHLLESTIFPLEIAHEHRNNLPSMGIILAAASFIPYNQLSRTKLIACFLAIAVVFGGITMIRAHQWGDAFNQALYEAIHHPNSPSAHTVFANIAHKTGHPKAAIASIEKAMELSPNEIGLSMYYQHILSTSQEPITEAMQLETLNRIKQNKMTPTAQLALSQLSDCLVLDPCKPLRKNYLEWVDAIIKKKPRMAYYYLFKGKAHFALGDEIKALNVFQIAFDMDQQFLHPLFEMADILIKQGDVENTGRILAWLKDANKKAAIPRDKELLKLEKNLNALKKALANEKLK